MSSFGRQGVGGQIGAGQVGVAREGCALNSVHQKAYLGDAGQVGAQRGADGEHGEGFGLDARGVAGRKAACQIDDGQLRAGLRGVL